MPIAAHAHDWAQEYGGYRCIAGNGCTAFFPLAVFQANLPSASGGTLHSNVINYNTVLNHAWKKSGGS